MPRVHEPSPGYEYLEGFAVWNFHYSAFTLNHLSYDIWKSAIEEEQFAIYKNFCPGQDGVIFKNLSFNHTLTGMKNARDELLRIIDDIACDRQFCNLMCAVNAYMDYV